MGLTMSVKSVAAMGEPPQAPTGAAGPRWTLPGLPGSTPTYTLGKDVELRQLLVVHVLKVWLPGTRRATSDPCKKLCSELRSRYSLFQFDKICGSFKLDVTEE